MGWCRSCCQAVHPIDQFCCGCSLRTGVFLILFLNLLSSVAYIAVGFANVVFSVDVFVGQVNLNTTAFNTGYALFSLPFILAGYMGNKYLKEPSLRIYLYFLLFTMVMDNFFLVLAFLVRDGCSAIPDVLKTHGNAFACGTVRITTYVFLAIILIFEFYCVFTVWSLCEELQNKTSNEDFEDLLRARGAARKKKQEGLGSGLFGTAFANSYESYPIMYGSLATQGLGGSTPIFGGKFHEIAYPPA